jgi:hypothetical protein
LASPQLSAKVLGALEINIFVCRRLRGRDLLLAALNDSEYRGYDIVDCKAIRVENEMIKPDIVLVLVEVMLDEIPPLRIDLQNAAPGFVDWHVP